ncbi:MAG: Uncharacterised protein [SAR116 cluster bacterium]|nr:MAG: Uncharacterised protein [SAR116 cluster bacterium]
MIRVRMGNNNRANRAFAKRFIHHLQRRCRRFPCHKRVDDDPAGIASNDRHIGIVEGSCLPYVTGYLEQPGNGVQLGHAP